MIKLTLFQNDINNSNCYVIQDQEETTSILIDPGSQNSSKIIQFIKNENLKLEYIILTHGHFDHIAGVSCIVNELGSKIISSELCSEKIVDPIKNLSYFTDFGAIQSPKADIFVENLSEGKMEWHSNTINFFKTPGHSRCSICIQIGKNLFVGDTLIKGLKTMVVLPDGNREELRKSILHIYETMPGDLTIFPGHGESFVLETQESSVALKK